MSYIDPIGRWWATYADGAVWPVRLVRPGVFPGTTVIEPEVPAPDAGQHRLHSTNQINDSRFNRPEVIH